MVEPVGFVEAWRAQFPESDPPSMELNTMGDIEQELDRCKASIRHLEKEVNKERFRMIYLQTLLAKERKSYDGQRWGFKRTPQLEDEDLPGGPDGQRSLTEETMAQEQLRGAERTARCKPLPEGGVDTASPGKQRGGSPEIPVGTGSVAALRSNFERIRRANSHTSGDGGGFSVAGGQERPFYVNMEFHHERGLVKVNDRHVSARISSLGCQAMQLERRRSPHSLPGNLSAISGDIGFNGSCDDAGVNAHLRDAAARQSGPEECRPYTSVYIGAMMGDGESRRVHIRDCSMEDIHLTWPRRSCSPGSAEDVTGGYTPDCSSNENLTSSEEDFSSGPSSLVSPSPTACHPPREKSRSPSQQSLDSSSPPTPMCHKQLQQQVVPVQTAITQKVGQMWPGHGNSTASSRTSHGDGGMSSRHTDTHTAAHGSS